eukprot:12042997-Alexandrium_andersonii.AAC.1
MLDCPSNPSAPEGKGAHERPTAEPTNAEDAHVCFRHLISTPARPSRLASRDGEVDPTSPPTPGEEMYEEMPKEMP